MRKLLATLLVLLVALPLLLVGIIWLRHGGGAEFPDRTAAPERPASELETVASLPTPPGNIAVSPNGRIFVSLHPEARPDIKIAELVDGQIRPFPSDAFQAAGSEPRHFRSVLSLRIDQQNRLWTLDNGHHGAEAMHLLAFDLDGNVVHEFVFPREVAGFGSHLNDFQVSADGRTIFIADASIFAMNPALIVYDVEKKSARRLLEGHPSVTAEEYAPVVQGRRMVVFGVFAIRPGVDSIALDKRGEWLYFAPVTNDQMYRVRAADLVDTSLSPVDLAGKVEAFAQKTMSDGITMDAADNIYVSDPEHSAIAVLGADRKLRTLFKDHRLSWPDGFSFGPDGWLYVTCSSLQHVIGRPPSSIAAHAPYHVFRFKPGPAGVPGH